MLNNYHNQLKQSGGSPCKGICTTTFDEVCTGCGRTVDEVSQWSCLAEEEKIIIWNRIILQGYFHDTK